MTFVGQSLSKNLLFSFLICLLSTNRILTSLPGSFKDVSRFSVIFRIRLLSTFNDFWESLIRAVMGHPFRVLYPVVECAYQDCDETFPYGMEVLEGEFALVELPVKEDMLYDILHMGLNPLRRGLVEYS